MLTYEQAKTALNSGKLSKGAEKTIKRIMQDHLAQRNLLKTRNVTDYVVEEEVGGNIKHNEAYGKAAGLKLECPTREVTAINPFTGDAMPLSVKQRNWYRSAKAQGLEHHEALLETQFGTSEAVREYISVILNGKKVPINRKAQEWIDSGRVGEIVQKHLEYWKDKV